MAESRATAASPASQFGEMSAEGSPGHPFRSPSRNWSEPVLNAAVVILLVVPPVVALGWLVVDSILGQI